MSNKTNITVIWWWAGTFNILYWLKKVFDESESNLAAIIAMTDSWWTAWEIRDKFWVLPPWDVRRWICALARDTWLVRQLFEYKFKWEEWVIWGNKLWNILITALWDIKWSFEAGLDATCEMFQVKWKIIPVTLEDVHLWVIFEDWTKVIWEKNIDVSETNPESKTHNIDQNIVDAFLVWWEWKINPRAKEAILGSDIVVIWPWHLYTSIVPNLLSKWMKEALAQTDAKIVYVCNIMADKWDTTTYEIPDFIDNVEKYAWNVIDYVLVNSWEISQETLEKYKVQEHKRPVKLKEWVIFTGKSYKIIERDFVNESDVVRHDPMKLAKTIKDISEQWIK